MKKTTLVITSLLSITLMILLTSTILNGGDYLSVLNANGTAASTGAPGESHTCSQAGCHGAGNGNGTSGGLADNAGPGNMSVTSIPAMTANMYTPGTTYSMIVTVNETGKTVFGFDAEILDNSGSTNLMVNNTTGTLVITNPTKTHIVQAFGTGRATVTHSLNAGLAANTATFGFNWKAPATGTVNFWASGVAGNNDNLANAMDNVYLFNKQVTPVVTGIKENETGSDNISLYPNPASDKISIRFSNKTEEYLTIKIVSMDGKLIKLIDVIDGKQGDFKGDYSVEGIVSGLYLLQVTSNHTNLCKKLYIN